jgi:hypothetical protein
VASMIFLSEARFGGPGTASQRTGISPMNWLTRRSSSTSRVRTTRAAELSFPTSAPGLGIDARAGWRRFPHGAGRPSGDGFRRPRGHLPRCLDAERDDARGVEDTIALVVVKLPATHERAYSDDPELAAVRVGLDCLEEKVDAMARPAGPLVVKMECDELNCGGCPAVRAIRRSLLDNLIRSRQERLRNRVSANARKSLRTHAMLRARIVARKQPRTPHGAGESFALLYVRHTRRSLAPRMLAAWSSSMPA